MGQILNVELIIGDKPIANVYMHWSAYTSSALVVAKDVLDTFKTEDVDKTASVDLTKMYSLIQKAIPGSSVPVDEESRLEKKGIDTIKRANKVDRNNGLIAFTEEEMEETRSWEEGRVSIHLDTLTVDFDVLWIIDKKEFIKEYKNSKFVMEDKFKYRNLSYDDFVKFKEHIDELISNKIYYIKVKGSKDVIGFIE